MVTNEKCVGKMIPFTLRDRLFELKGVLLSVWLAYWLHSDATGLAWPSLWRLERETGYSLDWVCLARKELVERGWLRPCGEQPRGYGARFAAKRFRAVIPSAPESVRNGVRL